MTKTLDQLKTLNQLSDEYNAWCSNTDIEAFLMDHGFSGKRMLSADELLVELLDERDQIKRKLAISDEQVTWLRQFITEWDAAIRAERQEAKEPFIGAYAVVCDNVGFGHTTVIPFGSFMEAKTYLLGQTLGWAEAQRAAVRPNTRYGPFEDVNFTIAMISRT